MDILQILKDLGIFTVLIAGLSLVFRSLGRHFIEKRFAAYQSELAQTTQQYRLTLDRDLEKYRNELKIEYLKHSRIHERRLEVILQLYKLLFVLDKSMRELTALLQVETGEDWETRRQREREEAADAYESFLDYFSENRIMLNEQTCSLVEELRDEYLESIRLIAVLNGIGGNM